MFFPCMQRQSHRSTWIRHRQTAGGPETQVVRRFQLGRITQSVADTANNSAGLLFIMAAWKQGGRESRRIGGNLARLKTILQGSCGR